MRGFSSPGPCPFQSIRRFARTVPKNQLAASLSRHGLDRRLAYTVAFWRSAGRDVAVGIFDEARALAPGLSQTSRNDLRRAEFRVRTLREKNRRQGYSRRGSQLLARRS